jgi:hypothetical protein
VKPAIFQAALLFVMKILQFVDLGFEGFDVYEGDRYYLFFLLCIAVYSNGKYANEN